MKNLMRNVTMCISATVLLLISVLQANAQKGEFGLRFMPTFSSFDIKTATGGNIKGETKVGFGAGAFLGFNISNYVGIQGEVIYTSLSQQYKQNDFERKINLRYVNIPLLLSLNTGKGKAVNFNIVAGPQIGISVGSSLKVSGIDGSETTKAVLSVKKGDLGVAYGAGVDFGLNPDRSIRLGIGYRGVLGLIDIRDNNNTILTDSYYILDRTHIKTNAAYIGLSFLF